MRVSSALVSLLVLAVSAAAQSIPACATKCSDGAAKAAGCSSGTDLGCICTSEGFQAAAARCVASACTPDEAAAASAIQKKACAGFNLSQASPTATAASTGPSSVSASSGFNPGTLSGIDPTPPISSFSTNSHIGATPTIVSSNSSPSPLPISTTPPASASQTTSAQLPGASSPAPNSAFNPTGPGIAALVAISFSAVVCGVVA